MDLKNDYSEEMREKGKDGVHADGTMDENTLKAVLKDYIEGAIGQHNSTIAGERTKALKYYRGEPMGTEVKGRSTVVSTDVSDTIESLLPGLLKIFTASDEAVVFDPEGPEDEETAKQKTDYINHVFYKDNDGFLVLYTMFKDALIQKTGLVKTYWKETDEHVTERYEGLTDEEIEALLTNNIDLEIVEHSQYIREADGMPLNDIKVRSTEKQGKAVVEAVPPEEFMISPRAKTIDDAEFSAHETEMTASDLIEAGYDAALVDKLEGYEGRSNDGEEEQRYHKEDYLDGAGEIDKSMRKILVTECYVRIDFDGDGVAELRKITVAGHSTLEILDNEEIDRTPICDIAPLLETHKFFGRSVAELVMDLQLIKSTVLRQILDNLYISNNQRMAVIEGSVTMDDLLTSRPGSIVRMTEAGAVTPLPTAPLSPAAFSMLEYLDTVRETRTGITRYNQGMDADSLNKTASGISQIMEAAGERKELIARVFAETGVKRIFRNILELVCKHQKYERMIKLRDTWVAMDPREWKTGYNFSINVGLGTGNKDQQLMHYNNLLNIQEKIVASGGMGKLVTEENIYNTLSKLVVNSGLKSPEAYFKEPSAEGEGMQEEEPAPEEMEAQIEMQKQQSELQLKQIDLQMKQIDAQIKMAELQQKEQETGIQAQMMQQQETGIQDQLAQLVQLAQQQNQGDKEKQGAEDYLQQALYDHQDNIHQ